MNPLRSFLVLLLLLLTPTPAVLAQYPLPTGVSSNKLRLWLRSDAEVIMSSGRVASWGDISGNEYGCRSAAASVGPELFIDEDREAYGLPAIAFTQRSYGLYSAKGLDLDMPGPYTMVIVVRPDDEYPRGIFALRGSDGVKSDFNDPQLFTLIHSRVEAAGSDYALGFTQGLETQGKGRLLLATVRGQVKAVIITRDGDGQLAGYLNGEKVAEDLSLSAISGLHQNSGYVIGDRFPVGIAAMLGTSDVFEVLVFNRALDAKEIEALNNYLTSERKPL